ncbi:MAG: hypothetical protein IPJ06_01880 [Saprospiraceae bacterium]|nr:hypothetical protein [Saprospiraceae bacterium]
MTHQVGYTVYIGNTVPFPGRIFTVMTILDGVIMVIYLIGRQGEQEISVSSFSEYSDQINDELLTRLPQSIERRIIQN